MPSSRSKSFARLPFPGLIPGVLALLFFAAIGNAPLHGEALEQTAVDRVIQYTQSTDSYALWDSSWATLPVGEMTGGRETRALLKFGLPSDWRSRAGTAESVTLRLTMTSRSGNPIDLELVALEENLTDPIRTADFRAAGRVVWGPVSSASLTTGATIEIDVTDPVRRMALRGDPAAFRIQSVGPADQASSDNVAVFAGNQHANASLRPRLIYHVRSPLATVSAVQPGTLSPGDLSPREQKIADYIGTLSKLANNVEDDSVATYGFITGNLWRAPMNEPYNARVQENAMTLGWFYSKPRPWNPYFADDALRRRLEAALAHLLTLQKEDGHFPEFPPEVEQTGNHKRAPTAFMLYYVAHLLQVLEEGPGINEDLRAEVVAAAERAADWFLNEFTDVWSTGRRLSNQLPPGLIGIYLLRNEFTTDFDALWSQRLTYLHDNAQSSAGFFYEANHVGHNYSFTVTTRDMAQLYELTGDPRVLAMQEKYIEWLGFNFIPEPDGIGFFINSAIDARHNGFNHIPHRDVGANNLWSQWIPAATVFGPSREESEAQREAFLQSNWDGTESLSTWVTPSVMAEAEYPESYLTAASRAESTGALPVVGQERFTDHRRDGHREFLFVRRPGYYLAANLRTRNTTNQRMGLSLLWHSRMGMLVQSQDVDNISWSVIHSGDLATAVIDADGDLPPTYWKDGSVVDASTLGPNDDFSITYAGHAGHKRVHIFDDRIERHIDVAGSFREQIPLILRPTDRLSWIGSTQEVTPNQSPRTTSATGFRLRREGHLLEIDWGERRYAQFGSAPNGSYFEGRRRLHRLILIAEDQLQYTMSVSPLEQTFDVWRERHFSSGQLAEAE